MVEEIKVDIVADETQLVNALDNVAKQIAKFSRSVNTGLENVADSLSQVADASRGIGSGIAQGAKQGTAELKKLDQQAQKTAKNISSTGPSRPLSDSGVQRVQAALADSPRQAQEQLNAELQREAQLRIQNEQAQRDSAAATEQAAKQQKIQADEAAKAAKAIAQKEKAEAELVNKTAIANVLFVRQEKLLDKNATQAQIMERAIARVNPAVQQAVNTLPRLRYALFDVARGATIISAGLAAIALAPVGLAISYEREFADVKRTTGLFGDEAERLRQDFIKLKQDIPISWAEITDIGSLAGQLGIASNLIADFTASVARFAATTDLNVTQSATLFGRLNQLIAGVDGQFEKLSSAINRVGVISVATESQIGAVAQNIASIANLSGFAASEVIGLAGSLASLGIAPELARGTVTRLFSNINRSISVGGRNLEEYGRLTGQTAEDFADAWGNAPAQALIDFFGGIDREGSRAERTLRELGITSVRDVPAILRLAQNQELVAELIRESADAFDEGLESQRQYSAITSTLSERLKLLTQNFQLLIAVSGETTAGLFGPLVDKANELVKALIELTNNDVAKFALFLASAVGLVISGFAGFVALLAITGAKAAGLVTALIDTQKALLGTSASAKIAEAGLLGYTRAMVGAALQTRLFINILKGFVVLAALTTAFAFAGAAINSYARSQRDAGQRAKDYFGEISSFTEAVKADTKAHLEGADAISVRTIEVQRDENAITQAETALRAWIKGQEDSERATRDNTDAVKDQRVAFGEAAFEIAADLVLDDEGYKRAAQDPAILAIFEAAGLTYQDVLLAAFDENQSARAVIDNLIEPIRQEFLKLQAEQVEIDSVRLGELFAGAAPVTQLEKDLIAAQNLYLTFIETLGPVSSALDDLVEDQVKAGEAAAFLGIEMNDAASLTGDAINEIITDAFKTANAARKTQDALSSLGDSFRELGDEALGASPELQGVITSILEEFSDAETAFNELVGLMSFLASTGADVTGPAMEYLRDVIDDLGFRAGLTTVEIDALLRNMANVPVVTNFAEGFNRVGRSARGARTEVKSFDDQMKELLDTLFEFSNNSQSASDAIFDLGAAFSEIGDEAFYAGSEMQDAITRIVAASSSGEEAVANLSALLSTLGSQSGVSSVSLDVLRQVIAEVGDNAGVSAARVQELIQTAGGGQSTVALNNFARGVQSVNQEVRTLVDYASDLTQVFSRAFDIRFKAVLNMDSITSTWEDLNKQVDDVTQSLAELSADRSVKEYFLSVAEAYGDSLRADTLRAELAEIDRDIAEAQSTLSREVVGDTAGARQNRATITGLVSQYQEYIGSLAESGASQEELRQAVVKARRDFEEQARQLGFSEQVIQLYGAAFDDVATAIDRVPRNITVDANVNPALQALNELNAALQRDIQAARTLNTELGKPIEVRQKVVVEQEFRPAPSGIPRNIQEIFGLVPQIIPRQRDLLGTIFSFDQGGFTGRGAKMEPAGVVHRGEYVVPKQYVNQSTGLPDPSFLAQLQNGMRSFQVGGFVGGPMAGGDGSVMVELSPYDRKLLENAGNVQLRLNGRVVAEATNQNNFNQARRGSD